LSLALYLFQQVFIVESGGFIMEEDEVSGAPKKNKILYIVIALVVIILILIFAVIPLASMNYFGVIGIPGLLSGSSNTQVLVIGNLSLGEQVVLDNLSYDFTYRVRSAVDLENSAGENLQEYDIIILDQTRTEKSISADLGDVLQKYVNKGGKLIIVMNSGIKQSLGFNGVEATDVIGWATTLGDIVPAECILLSGNEPSCKEGNEVAIVGRIVRNEVHPIMEGIELSPTQDEPPYALMALPIQVSAGAKTIASFDIENTPGNYPAILEKKNFPFGNVIYFNYDPGVTPNIFKNTLIYLK
jgi:hypothetical protein